MKQTEFLSECSSRFQEKCKTQIKQNSKHCTTEQKAPKSTRNSHPTSEPSRTSTTALGHVLPLKFWLLNKRFQIHTLHTKDNRNSSELIRTDPNTDGQQRKRTKQIQKLSNVNFLLENCSGKSIFDKVQLSTGAMPKSSVTFPSTNGRKMQETRTMSILPFSN